MEVEEKEHTVSVGLITHITYTHKHIHSHITTHTHTQLWRVFLWLWQNKERCDDVFCCQVVCVCMFGNGAGRHYLCLMKSLYLTPISHSLPLRATQKRIHACKLTHIQTAQTTKKQTSENFVIFITRNFWLKVASTNFQGRFNIPQNLKNIDRLTWEFCSNFRCKCCFKGSWTCTKALEGKTRDEGNLTSYDTAFWVSKNVLFTSQCLTSTNGYKSQPFFQNRFLSPGEVETDNLSTSVVVFLSVPLQKQADGFLFSCIQYTTLSYVQ